MLTKIKIILNYIVTSLKMITNIRQSSKNIIIGKEGHDMMLNWSILQEDMIILNMNVPKYRVLPPHRKW